MKLFAWCESSLVKICAPLTCSIANGTRTSEYSDKLIGLIPFPSMIGENGHENNLRLLSMQISDDRQTMWSLSISMWSITPHAMIPWHTFGPCSYFFKRVVWDAENFKNILKALATRHQSMMACLSACPSAI